jgi:hypothetical protein
MTDSEIELELQKYREYGSSRYYRYDRSIGQFQASEDQVNWHGATPYDIAWQNSDSELRGRLVNHPRAMMSLFRDTPDDQQQINIRIDDLMSLFTEEVAKAREDELTRVPNGANDAAVKRDPGGGARYLTYDDVMYYRMERLKELASLKEGKENK